MHRCSQTAWGGTDPACVFTKCRGAVSLEERLTALSACSRRECAEPCEVGKSYGCVGHYDWPPAPSDGFDFGVSIEIWNDTWDPSGPHLVGATVAFCNDTSGGLPAPIVECPDSPLGLPGITDAAGSVTLHVPLPFPGVGVGSTPPFHVYVGGTSSSPTQRYPTLPVRSWWNAPLRPWADTHQMTILPHGHPTNGTTRVLCGSVLDCHGSRALAAEGLELKTNIPYPDSAGAVPVVYWHADGIIDSVATDSTGNFCVYFGNTDNTTPDPSGVFALDFTGASTNEPWHLNVAVPSEGHVGLLVFPQSASQR